MGTVNSVCVYCGSGPGRNPAFAQAATALGRAFAEADIRLIYGGGSVGLMGLLARSVLNHGGRVTGIIPHFLQRREQMLENVTELIVTEDMHERKMMMFEHAEAFVALPGGVGTLEEVVEQMTWAQLGRHDKPVMLANLEGFWDPLIALLDDMKRDSFIRPGMEVGALVAQTVDEIVPMLQRAAVAKPQRTLDQPAEAGIRQM